MNELYQPGATNGDEQHSSTSEGHENTIGARAAAATAAASTLASIAMQLGSPTMGAANAATDTYALYLESMERANIAPGEGGPFRSREAAHA